MSDLKLSILRDKDTVEELQAEIERGHMLIRNCVGTLYPSIIVDDMNKLRTKMSELLSNRKHESKIQE